MSTQGVVAREASGTLLTAIRTSSTRIGTTMVGGSTRTGTDRTTGGIATMALPSLSRKSLHFSSTFTVGEFCFKSVMIYL
ncbi:MAG: hypothetical protein V1704_00665 [Candidatus Vogelbacteria bacterium]